MDRVGQLLETTPPNTMVWMGLICCLSFVTTNRLVAPAKLAFLPGKIKQEPWRLVTLFFYIGDFLIYFLQAFFLILWCLASFETNYSLHQDIIPKLLMSKLDSQMKERLQQSLQANRTIDYTYFLFSVGLTIVVVARVVEATTSVQFLILGPMLERVIHYLTCRTRPDQDFFYFGIRMPARYSPWLLAIVEILFDPEYHRTFREVVQTRSLAAIGRFLGSKEVISIAVGLSVGHVWWFMRFFLMTEVYGGWLDVFDEQARGTLPDELLRVMLQYVFTPPWYYYTVRRILEEDTEHEPVETDQPPVQEQDPNQDQNHQNRDQDHPQGLSPGHFPRAPDLPRDPHLLQNPSRELQQPNSDIVDLSDVAETEPPVHPHVDVQEEVVDIPPNQYPETLRHRTT